MILRRPFCVCLCTGFASAQPCEPYWSVDIGNPGMNSSVISFLQRDFDEGERVLVSGAFWEPYVMLALWDGDSWARLEPQFTPASGIVDLEVFDDGDGEKLYILGNMWVGGDELWHVARYDGSRWTFIDNGDPANAVSDMVVWDDGTGPALYVTGDFDTLDGVTTHNSIAKWDGERWQPLNAGINAGFFRIGLALDVFDDGSGAKLYLGGTFEKVDGETIKNIARWDGQEWTGFGFPDQGVEDLCVHDDGSGPALYAVGDFESVSGKLVGHVARWDGVQWTDLDGGIERPSAAVYSCGVFDNGSGVQLYISGDIRSASGKPMCNIARWDGAEWHDVAGGLECGTTQGAFDLLGLPPDSAFGPALFAGGSFTQAGGQPTNYIAEYRPCHCPADFNGDGQLDSRDLIAFLNAWAASDPRADFNADGATDTRDVIAFLNAWAAGC